MHARIICVFSLVIVVELVLFGKFWIEFGLLYETIINNSSLFTKLKFAFQMRFAHAHSYKTTKRHVQLVERLK